VYKTFVDDSGKKNFHTPYAIDFVENPPTFEGYEEFWRDNYFVLCGVRVSGSVVDTMKKEIYR